MKVPIYVDNNNIPHGYEEAIEIAKDYIDSYFDTYWEDFVNGNNFSATDLYDAIINEDGATINLMQERWEEFVNYETNECLNELFTVYEIDA